MSYHQRKLANGSCLITVPVPSTKATAIFVFFKVGSRYESRAINGAAHFIEHLMFKGTTKRPSTLAIAKLLDGVGAHYNAFTSKDVTGYYIKLSADHQALAVDVLSDIVLHSLFDPAEITKERGAITEEINMYQDNPALLIDDLAETAVFGDRHPLGWNILGPREVIKRVDRTALLKFRNQHYTARNMWIIAAGHLDPKLPEMIDRAFRAVPAGGRPSIARPYRGANNTDKIRLKFRETEQVQIALGVQALKYTDPQRSVMSVLATILGSGLSSRLFTQIRERRGLCYSITASAGSYEDTGSFIIQAGLDKKRLPEALRAITAELQKIMTTSVGVGELARAKDNIRGSVILGLEDSDAVASWYGRQALFQRRIQTPDEALQKIDRVTAADVRSLAARLFKPQRRRLAVIGPFQDPKFFRPLIW